MEEFDDVVQEIDNLPDDLFLDDVGPDKSDKKFTDWLMDRNRSKKRRGVEEDMGDVFDLNAPENWDLGEEDIDVLKLEKGPSKKAFRSHGPRGRGGRGQFRRGGGQRPFRNEGFKRAKAPEDVFDIESKSHYRSAVWGRGSLEQEEHLSPNYRKDVRLGARPGSETLPPRNTARAKPAEVAGPDIPEHMYAPARKDPRLVPQQALPPRLARANMRKDRKAVLPPGVEEPSAEQTPIRRGPRSPAPLSPPHKLSASPPVRKRERSPMGRMGRIHRERSLSPRWRSHHNSLSPRRREWRSGSREPVSPGRRMRRSPSPRSRRRHSREREWSGSPRRDIHSHSHSRSRERSPSDRRDPSMSLLERHPSFSPPRRSSLSSSRDESWRPSPERAPPPPQYRPMQPLPPQQPYEVLGPPPPSNNMYSEGNYSAPAPPQPAPGPPAQSYGAPPNYPNYQQYGYDNYYQQPPPPVHTYSGDYVPPPPQPPAWNDGGMVYPDMSQPPPLQMSAAAASGAPTQTPAGAIDPKSEEAKKEAVKNELIQQKQTLSKQREEYLRKKSLISRELELLREQEEELLEENSRDNDRILKENHKLQLEIQNKLKAINNVIDMLTGIIGDKASSRDSEKKKPKTPPETPPQSSPSVPEHEEDRKEKPVYNYVHYDPEMHWCRVCNVFPRTAKEYLNHLHSVEHKEETMERKLVDMPWHKNMPDQEVPHIPGAPTKRTPIRGLQFFISATAWYCKLCDIWIGDLHCASLHLKSKRHAENYAKFTEQNPHWETDWLADREREYEACSEERRRMKDNPANMDLASSSTKQSRFDVKDKGKKKKDVHKKTKKNCLTALDETKKKKRRKKKKLKLQNSASSSSNSSSSSSSSEEKSDDENEDKSKSIRVAMRNKMQPALPLLPRSRWDSPPEDKPSWIKEEEKVKQVGDDKLIREWMSTSKDVSDGEKQLLNSIKDRLRQKQEADKERERERRDDRRDNRRGRRPSDNLGSPSYQTKRSRSDKSPDDRRERSSRFDRYDKHEGPHKSPRRESSGSKSEQQKGAKEEPADLKAPDKKSEAEKKAVAKFEEGEEDDEESAESKFEKQTAEAAARLLKKAKKPPVMTVPKSKLPFIGRMPILKHFAKKKKPEDESKTESEMKTPEDPLVEAQYKLEFSNVGGKIHIGPPGPELPPPNHEVQDMDIDEDTSNSDNVAPSAAVADPPASSPTPKKPVNDIPLPKDFQDALNILFPGQETLEKKEEVCSSSGVIQSGPKPPSVPQNQQQGPWPPQGPPMMPPMQGYGGPPMMGPMHGMHGPPQGPQGMYGPPHGPPYGMPMMGPPHPNMMQKSERPIRPPPPPPPPREAKASPKKEVVVKKPDVGEMSADELAMLGIDAGDIGAQSF